MRTGDETQETGLPPHGQEPLGWEEAGMESFMNPAHDFSVLSPPSFSGPPQLLAHSIPSFLFCVQSCPLSSCTSPFILGRGGVA